MKLDYNNIISTVLAASVIGLGSFYYAKAEEVSALKTEIATVKNDAEHQGKTIQEIKQDLKEMKQEQAKANEEQKELSKEILAELKKKNKS